MSFNKQMVMALVICAALVLSPGCSEKDCAGPVPDWCHLVDLSNQYDPVCGCDGKTYLNAGHAQCLYGIENYTEGACK